MQLSATASYAIKILCFMAQNKSNKYSSRTLSQELNIPYKYLTRIMTKLKNGDLLTSTQGKYGGFSLKKDSKEIRVIDIIIVFDDADNKRCVLEDTKCNFEHKCILHDKWEKPRCAIDDVFAKTTLFELSNQAKENQ